MLNSDDDLLKELLLTFRVEAAEHIQTLNQVLLQAEREKEQAQHAELVKTAFRAAHSLKGAARAVDLHDVESLAHHMESVLQDVRDEKLELAAHICDALYDVLDALEQLIQGKTVDTAALNLRMARLNSAQPSMHSDLRQGKVAESRLVQSEETIRVTIDKLDNLMAEAGELLVSKISTEQRLAEMRVIRKNLTDWTKKWRDIKQVLSHVEGQGGQKITELLHQYHDDMQRLAQNINDLDHSLNRDSLRLGMVAERMQEEIRRVRMVPFDSLALTLQRVVRDAANSQQKNLSLAIEGGEIELDKKVLEMLKDPLIHLLRNAVNHGIEMPAQREALGKPAEGRITINVKQRGGEMRLAVSDDGHGFDVEAIRKAAIKQVKSVPDENSPTHELISLAFLPGVSTAETVTEIAGRGIGLDVVREQIEVLHGQVVIESVSGQGVTIGLVVPVSLTMMRGLIVRVGQEQYVLPLLAVEKIVEPESYLVIEGRTMLDVDGKKLPLVSLAQTLQRSANGVETERNIAVIVTASEHRIAVLVDDVVTEQEFAAKPLPFPLHAISNISSVAVLGNGGPILILNVSDLVKSSRMVDKQPVLKQPKETNTKPNIHILVVDDSITTRTLERNILEAAGYKVTTATDGLEALKRLKTNIIDLVVADVEMPNMDGITLTRSLRMTSDYTNMPVILVTSLESREDRERGLVEGANAYIVKRGFDQAELLTTIQRLL